MKESLNDNPKEFWKAVLGQIQLEVSPMVFKTMVSRTKGVSFENDTLEVFCEDNFVKKNLETKFSSVVDNSVKNIGGKGIKIKYSVSKEKVMYIVADEGAGFNFENYMDGTSENPNESFLSHGRGIMMTKNAFDEITYSHKGNHVMLIKKFGNKKETGSPAE